MRLSDPGFTKIYIDSRLEVLRGGRPKRHGRHVARPN